MTKEPSLCYKMGKLSKKPKLWNIAILTGLLAVVLFFLVHGHDPFPLGDVCIALFAYLLLVLLCLANAFFRQLKYNLYSYNAAYYLGFFLFVLVLAISHGFITLQVLSSPESYGLIQIISNISDSTRLFIILSLAFLLIYSIGLFVSNILLMHRHGVYLLYWLGLFLALVMIAGAVFIFLGYGSVDRSKASSILLDVFYALYLYCDCMITGSIVAGVLAAAKRPPYDRDFIIILGCGLNPDGTPGPILTQRIKAAIRFYQEQNAATKKVPILIPSGGKGSDDHPSESEAMYRYLLAKGIPAEHIIKEDQSTTTYENFTFSKKIISGRCPEANISYVTASYHVYRSGIMAGHAGVRSIGISARIRWYYWPNAMLREFISLLSSHIGKQVLVFLAILVIYALPFLLTLLTDLH